MINIGIVGDYLGENSFNDIVDAQVHSTITAYKIKSLVKSLVETRDFNSVNLITLEASALSDTIYSACTEFGDIYDYDTKLTLLMRNESTLRKYIGCSAKALGKYDSIIYTDSKTSLHQGSLRTVKERELNKEQYFVDSCDIIIHLWEGDIEEFNKYTRMLKGRKKKRFIIDSFSLEILEVD